MRGLREFAIKAIRAAVPLSQNLNKAFHLQQGKEGPFEFLSRLKGQMRKCCGLDPEDPLGQ